MPCDLGQQGGIPAEVATVIRIVGGGMSDHHVDGHIAPMRGGGVFPADKDPP